MKRLPLLAALAPLTLGACATLFGANSPFAFDKKGDLVEYNYAWSAEASRNRALVRYLRADLEREFTATTAAAEADRAAAKASGRLFKGHRFSRRWTTAGQSPRLLSLEARTTAFAGGEANRYSSKALLWDRRAARPVTISALITTPQALAGIICPAPAPCPRLDQLTLVPADRDRDGRFDTLRIVSDRTGASDTERYQVTDRPVDARLLAVLSPAYRAGFEVGQPQ